MLVHEISIHKQWTLTFPNVFRISVMWACVCVCVLSYQWQLTVAVKLQTKVIYGTQPEIVKITLNQLYPFTWSLPLCACVCEWVQKLMLGCCWQLRKKYVPSLFTATAVSVLSFIVTVTRRCTFAFCFFAWYLPQLTWKRHQFHHISFTFHFIKFSPLDFPSVS